jgi:exocyst complex component 4
MRDQPAPPPSQPSRRNLGAIQTQNIRRTSNASAAGGYDIAASPITPASANGISPQKPGNALFTDPFATDRSQRSELRAQTSEAAQREAQPFHGGVGDKLKNVVGAFMTASKGREEPPVLRPGKSRARQAGKEEVWDVSSAEGGKFGAIDGVLGKIRKDWPFVLESDFSPSTLALSLLSQTPSTTLPTHPSLSSFLKLHDALSSSLQSAVQAHFQSFAASLPAHASFLSTLARAQQQVRTSKDALKEARDGFAGKGKSELAGVRARERVVRDMLKILDIM